jgi:hypothetical protein
MNKKTFMPCKPGRDVPRGASFGYLGIGVAFLAVAFLGKKPAFTGDGFAFLGLGIAFLANHWRRSRDDR